MQFLDVCRYVGPAPVPLAQYNAYMRACMARGPTSIAICCRPASSSSIVNKGMFDQLGPAVNSGKALFLYGAPGNGKTVLAEGIGRALGMEMYVPHAIDVDGQVITTFDAVSHQPIASKARRVAERPRQRVATIAGGKRSSGRWSSSAAS